MVFFKLRFTLLTSLSQKPPHQGAFSTINFQETWRLFKNLTTSEDRAIFTVCFEEALKVLALSLIYVTGKPRRLANLRNNRRKEEANNSGVNSKCTAHVERQVKRQTYAFDMIVPSEDCSWT